MISALFHIVDRESGTPTQYRGVAVRGEEAISDLFVFHIAFTVPVRDDGSDAEARAFAARILGSDAFLGITFLAGQRRPFHFTHQRRFGMISEVRSVRVVGNGSSRLFRFEVTFVPRLYRLALRKRSRIFQDVFVHDVAVTLLQEHKVPFRFALERRYPKRQYCVQYQETDLAFLRRLFADEGIAFYFEHRPPGGEDLRLEAVHDAMTVEEALELTANIIGATGTVFNMLGGNSGVLGTIGGMGSLTGDLLRGPERDPDTVVERAPGAGGWDSGGALGDILCFVDEATGYVRHYPDDATDPSSLTVNLHLEQVAGLVTTGREAWDFLPIVRVGTEAVDTRDHDFRRPLLSLQAARSLPQPVASPSSASLEAYEHHGEHDPPYVTTPKAETRLEQYRADVSTAVGRSPCPRILPGHVFHLEGVHMDGESESSSASLLPSGQYATVRTRHRWSASGDTTAPGWEGLSTRSGRTADDDPMSNLPPLHAPEDNFGGYICEIECVSATALYRPQIQTRAPRAVSETAMVVGPAGQEIFTDRHGRVKIQFHWDREGPWTDRSSAFVRVAQPWAGAGFGFQFLPRIGQEVLVTFLGGDPDRPVIVGSLYDGVHPHPEPLPERSTRSGIRTQSTPGGGGFNELIFEDAKDEERLTLRAERTLEQVAKGDHTLTVGEDQRVLISGDSHAAVVGEERRDVGRALAVQIGEDRTEHVGGSTLRHVHVHESDRVEGTSVRTVGGADIRLAEHDDVSTIRGSQSISVRGNAMIDVGADSSRAGNAVVTSHGNVFVTSEKNIIVQGLNLHGENASHIVFRVGNTQINVGPRGILFEGDLLSIVGRQRIILDGHGHTITLDEDGGLLEGSPIRVRNRSGSALKIEGGDIKIESSSSVEVKSGGIQLKQGGTSGGNNQGNSNDQQTQDNIHIEMTHGRVIPQPEDSENPTFVYTVMPDMPCRIVFDNGTIVSDKGIQAGMLDFYAPDDVHQVTVEPLIDMITNDDDRRQMEAMYPSGLRYVIKLLAVKQLLPDAGSAEGKRIRLANLGYTPGSEVLTGDELDEMTEHELRRFQERQSLLESENLQTATRTRLEKLFGDS